MRVKNTAGHEHTGVYCAYIRVSTDKQDVARQEMEIEKWLNGGDHQVIWFKEEGVEFVNLIPHSDDISTSIFQTRKEPKLSFLNEFLMLFDKNQIQEGGFFVIIGRKKK